MEAECASRKLFYYEERCEDMICKVGSWRQDVSYEGETDVRKRRGCCFCCGWKSQNVCDSYRP